MKKSNWLMTVLALAFAVVLAGAVPAWAQQGRGGGPRGQGSQWCLGGGQGPGPGRAYRPNYRNNQDCPYYRGDNSQQAPRGRRGMGGGGPGNQSATQTAPPAVAQ
jgi:hypothetical protein